MSKPSAQEEVEAITIHQRDRWRLKKNSFTKKEVCLEITLWLILVGGLLEYICPFGTQLKDRERDNGMSMRLKGTFRMSIRPAAIFGLVCNLLTSVQYFCFDKNILGQDSWSFQLLINFNVYIFFRPLNKRWLHSSVISTGLAWWLALLPFKSFEFAPTNSLKHPPSHASVQGGVSSLRYKIAVTTLLR